MVLIFHIILQAIMEKVRIPQHFLLKVKVRVKVIKVVKIRVMVKARVMVMDIVKAKVKAMEMVKAIQMVMVMVEATIMIMEIKVIRKLLTAIATLKIAKITIRILSWLCYMYLVEFVTTIQIHLILKQILIYFIHGQIKCIVHLLRLAPIVRSYYKFFRLLLLNHSSFIMKIDTLFHTHFNYK